MANIQVNMRCPVTAKDLVQDVCTRLRNDKRFEEKLRTFLANEGAQQDQDLREKVDELQGRLRHLEVMLHLTRPDRMQIEHDVERGKPDSEIARERSVPAEIVANVRALKRGTATEATEAPSEALETGERRDLLETADSGHAGAGEAPTPGPWKESTDRRAKLTANGRAEVDRRIRAGERDKDIAAAVGVTRSAVNARRRKHHS